MVIASMADLVGAMREGVIPAEVAYGRIVEALKRGQKTVFGDTEETAWCLLVLGGVTTMNSGFGVDMTDAMRAEILAVADHFCHWAELTYAKVRQRSARDDDTTAYYDLEGELAAYAREREAFLGTGMNNNVYVMLGDTSIIRRNAATLGAHSGRLATPDFESVKHDNGLEKAVMSVIKCTHVDGGHVKVHNL